MLISLFFLAVYSIISEYHIYLLDKNVKNLINIERDPETIRNYPKTVRLLYVLESKSNNLSYYFGYKLLFSIKHTCISGNKPKYFTKHYYHYL